MVKAGVIGATGYSGQEAVDVLLKNPGVEITCLTARLDTETKYSDIYPKFAKKTQLTCRKLDVKEVSAKCDVVFLALPHTVSMGIAPEFLKEGVKVIDLSADYRLEADVFEKWYGVKHTDIDGLKSAVYGLPEVNREKIKKAKLIANPGCFPTGVILGLLPIIKTIEKSGQPIIVDSKSGVTGAGRKATIPLSFSEVDENFKSYKANEHQHMPEMERVLSGVTGKNVEINFTPHLLPLRRGILSTIYVPHKGLPEAEELYLAYQALYKNEPFVRVRPYVQMPEVQDVTGTNYCDIGIKVARGMLVIVAVIDNLLKGASGQAVQNMNIMCGLDERAGLV